MALLISGSAYADVIDVTPGGFTPDNPPRVFQEWLDNHFQVDAVHLANEYQTEGWDPQFYGPPYFVSTPLGFPSVTLAWIRGLPYHVRWFFTGGPDPTNIGWVNMYEVTGRDEVFGSSVLTVNGVYPVIVIGVYGTRRGVHGIYVGPPQHTRASADKRAAFMKEMRMQ